MRYLTFLIFFAACSSPPTDRRWIHAQTDYGMYVAEGRFVRAPKIPMTICVADRNNVFARTHTDVIVEGLLFWKRLLEPHLQCPLFDVRPVGDTCDISIVGQDSINYSWGAALAVARIEISRKIDPYRIIGCQVAFAEHSWESARAEWIMAHELGHCMGLADDPFFGTPPRSVMETHHSTSLAGLTEMDARLLIGGLECQE